MGPKRSAPFVIANVRVIDYPEWARMGFYAMPVDVSQPAMDVGRRCARRGAGAWPRKRRLVDHPVDPSRVRRRVLDRSGCR